MNWAEVSALSALAGVLFVILSAFFRWLWIHGKRLNEVELKVGFLEAQQKDSLTEIRSQLVRIEYKLDRSIEREIREASDDDRS